MCLNLIRLPRNSIVLLKNYPSFTSEATITSKKKRMRKNMKQLHQVERKNQVVDKADQKN